MMVRFFGVDLEDQTVVVCNLCASLVLDDLEGANRRDHEATHAATALLAEELGATALLAEELGARCNADDIKALD
jgi:hypothetical protein